MRINKFVAQASGLSRRAVDTAIKNGRILVDGQPATIGQAVNLDSHLTLDGQPLRPPAAPTTIALHKPAGYVVSRLGQGSRTIYDLLPKRYHGLKPVGRLDKDSSGLLLLTDDGQLAQQLTHPSYQKEKVYEVVIDRPLAARDLEKITKAGVGIGEKQPSRFKLQQLENSKLRLAKPLPHNSYFRVTLSEGKNRQIRRTFAALDYTVIGLHRTGLGPYQLGDLPAGKFTSL